MNEYKPIPIERRVWLLDRMVELRDELSNQQRGELLVKLRSMTYFDWSAWFISNTEVAAGYAASTCTERKRHRRRNDATALLVHHAAMFMTGLHEIARDYVFPEVYRDKGDRFFFETSAMAVTIRAWDDIEKQAECSLFWQFDEPPCHRNWPFSED